MYSALPGSVKFRLLVLVALLATFGRAAAGELELREDAVYALGPVVEILEDPAGTLTIREVLKRRHELPFKPVFTTNPNLGLNGNVHWVRFRIRDHYGYHPDRRWLLELDFPFADRAELFVPAHGGGFEREVLGDRQKFADRTWKHRSLVFTLGRVPEAGAEYYLRVQASGSLQLPLRVWTPAALSSHLSSENLVLGLYYGIMVAMLIYNLFVYTVIREKNYLRYCEYLFLFLCLQVAATGHGFQYLWQNFPSLGNLLPTLLAPLTCMAAIRFAQPFLEIADRRPELVPWVQGTYYFCCFALVLTLIAPLSWSIPVAVLAGCITAIMLLFCCLRILRRGSRPAQFFLAAWLLLLFGALMRGLSILGLLPVNAFTLYTWQVGSGLEVLLLSLGLADRINILRQERMSALQQAFELEKVAHTDRLTGLYNRTYFEREFRQHVGYAEKNRNSHFGFFLIDLVGLKAINDNHGHAIGDQAVRMTARMLKGICRQSDLVARIGGDEFAIICPRMTPDDYRVFVQRIDGKTANGRIKFQEEEEIKVVPIHLSIGHAHTSEIPAGEIFDYADKDMYEKKRKFYETHERHREEKSSGAQTVAE